MRSALGALALAAGSVRLYFRNFGVLFPLAFAPALALSLLGWALSPTDAPDPTAMAAANPFAALIHLAVNVGVGFLVTGVMCLAALDAALGKRHTLSEYLGQTLRHAAALVVLGVLLSIATAAGVVLAVLPGLYIAARWLPWAQAVLFENLGWSGLGRAQALTEGRRWPLVGALVLMALPVTAILVAAGLVLAFVGDGPVVVVALTEAVATAIYYGLVACFTALAYLRLRALAEGLDAAAIAAAID